MGQETCNVFRVFENRNLVWDIPLQSWVAMQQPILNAGTVTISGPVAVTGPLTDAQLRATPVPVTSTAAAPNLDTGPGATVPEISTSITASQAYLLGAHFTNGAGATRTVTVTNTAGAILLQRSIPAGGEMPYNWNSRPSLGVKWIASGADVKGQIWGIV